MFFDRLEVYRSEGLFLVGLGSSSVVFPNLVGIDPFQRMSFMVDFSHERLYSLPSVAQPGKSVRFGTARPEVRILSLGIEDVAT